jgi:hypothetical protein
VTPRERLADAALLTACEIAEGRVPMGLRFGDVYGFVAERAGLGSSALEVVGADADNGRLVMGLYDAIDGKRKTGRILFKDGVARAPRTKLWPAGLVFPLLALSERLGG